MVPQIRHYAPYVHLSGDSASKVYHLYILSPVTQTTQAIEITKVEYEKGATRVLCCIIENGSSPDKYAKKHETLEPEKYTHGGSFNESTYTVEVYLTNKPKNGGKKTTFSTIIAYADKEDGGQVGSGEYAMNRPYIYLTNYLLKGTFYPRLLVPSQQSTSITEVITSPGNSYNKHVQLTITTGSGNTKIFDNFRVTEKAHEYEEKNFPAKGYYLVDAVIKSPAGILTGGKKTKTLNKNADDKPTGFGS